jgi:hypothetical protein
MSTGDYYRFDLHKERARRLSILAQPSRVGRPRYLETADLTDWARITRKAIQRVAQVATLNGVDGADAWKLEATVEDNNFILKGGDNTDDGAKAAWLGGLRALLYRDTDYECTLNAPNEQDLFAIHHRVTSAAVNLITDTASKYTVNALTGYEVHVEGAGDFTVLSNTASTISLSGFTPGDYGFTDASRPYYWVKLKPPFEDATQLVYLDIHIEDWGMEEDSELNHNPRGAPVEWARREVLVQRVYVNQNDASPIVDYVDSSGRKHYVLKIGALVRAAGDDAIGEVIDDNREDQASSAQETLDARGFAHFEVGVDHNDDGTVSSAQPTTLADRLAREESLLVVGPNGDPGIYTGPDGLLEALAINTSFSAPSAPHTVFLRNGIYDFSGKGTIVVPAGWTLVGESRNVRIGFDSTAEFGMQVEPGAKVENIYLSSSSADNPGILLAGSDSYLGRGATLSRCTVTATISDGDTPAILVRGYEDSTTGVVTGGTTIRDCQIFKSRGLAVKVELRNVGAAVQNSARAAFSNGTSGEIDSYHVNIENCRIYSGRQLASAGAFKKTNAALNISTHASVLVNRTLLVGDENPALYISGSNATTFRHQVFFSDCTFLGLCRDGEISGVGLPSLVSAAYQPFTELNLARVEGGSTIFDSCLWDTCHPGASFSTLSVGPLSLLSVNDEAGTTPSCRVSASRFEVIGGTSTASKAVGVNVKLIGTGGLVEVSGCTARALNIGYPKALFYLENVLNESAVSISDCSADLGDRACSAFWLVGNIAANDNQAMGGQPGDNLIVSRAQVDSVGSVGLRVDAFNLAGVPVNSPVVTLVNGFKAIGCGGVGVALLGLDSIPFSRAALSSIMIDGLKGVVSTTSVGVVIDNFYGVSISNIALGGIKSCGVFSSDVDTPCAVSDITVHEVGTAQDSSIVGFQPWHAAALVNIAHASGLKFYSRARSAGVPAKMHLGAYYSGGTFQTRVTVQGFDIQQASGGCNGVQLGRVGALFYGVAAINNCNIHDVDRAISVYQESTVYVTSCNFQNFRLAAAQISGSRRVEFSSCELYSIIKNSLGIIAALNFDNLRIFTTRIRSKSKAVSLQAGTQVFISGCILNADATPLAVSVTDVTNFEMVSTSVASSTSIEAPTAIDTITPTNSGLSLGCSGVSRLKLKDCTFQFGAIVVQSYQIHADRCVFSTSANTGVVVLPPTLSPGSTEVTLTDCEAWGNSLATTPALQCAVWVAPIRNYDVNVPYSRSLWCNAVTISGGSYTAGTTHGDLFTSVAQPRPAVVRLDVLNVVIKSSKLTAQGASTAAVIAGNMDYIETESVAPALYSHRFGVDRFQFRSNEVFASSGVVIAVLEPAKPHEVRDNLFRSSSLVDDEIPERNCFYITTTEDDDGAFGTNNDYMTRVLYTGNCHMIMGRELPEGQLSLPKYAAIVTSYSVCLDAFGNLQREVDAVQASNGFLVDGAAGPNDEYLGMVEKLNSIRRLLKRIQADGTLADERLRLQEW